MNWNEAKSDDEGRVIWITGLSGAGKSTIARAAVAQLRATGEPPVLLDGDAIREAIADPHTAHDPASRLANAYRISHLAKLFADQGHTVFVATMSIFHEIHAWNRVNLPNYLEVWVEVALGALRKRDARGLYSRHENGDATNVPGMDLDYERPLQPDLVLDNNPPLQDPGALAGVLLDHIQPEPTPA